MGLGGYLAARTDAEHYYSELQREIDETQRSRTKRSRKSAEFFRVGG